MASVAMEMAIANYKEKAARRVAPTEHRTVITPKGKTLYTVRRAKQ